MLGGVGVGGVGVGGVGVGGVGVGVGGLGALHIDGCPEQVYPCWIWQFLHPDENLFPVSQVSAPTMSPSPHLGVQTPAELGAYPWVEQVSHLLADEQVLHEPGQATHPRLASKYYPEAHLTGLKTNFSQTPKMSL